MLAGLWMIVGSLFGIWCGFAAIERNRSAVPWWLFGVLAGPVAVGVLWAQGRREGPKALL